MNEGKKHEIKEGLETWENVNRHSKVFVFVFLTETDIVKLTCELNSNNLKRRKTRKEERDMV